VKLAAKGDVKFRPLMLLYGANGQGKTTIAGVLRSLHNGDAAFVNERSSAGSPVSPNAELASPLFSSPPQCKKGTYRKFSIQNREFIGPW
jgi:hypothetical protein